jgi:hypothetical protein
MRNKIAEIAGWYGAIAIVAAYLLVSFKIVAPDALIFQILNLTGAIGIIWISVVKREKQTIVLNIFWAGIAIISILNVI